MSSLALLATVVASQIKPEEHVNILQGTYTTIDLSSGNTIPLVGRPWGMNTWSVLTNPSNEENGFWFHPLDRKFYGIKCTHQPSPWMNDYAHFTVLAAVGGALVDSNNRNYGNFDATFNSNWKPYEISTQGYKYNQGGQLAAIDIYAPKMSVTATERASIINVAFGEPSPLVLTDQSRSITVTAPLPTDTVKRVNQSYVTLETTMAQGCSPEGQCPTFRMYVVMYFDCDVTSISSSSADGQFVLGIDNKCADLDIKIGTSYISLDMAHTAVTREVGTKNYASLMAESKQAWNEHLSRLKINDMGTQPESTLTTLYSSLYRASMFPRKMFEINGKGENVHYSPYVTRENADKVYPGVLSTDHGFWDAYRTVYPLLTLIYPDKLGVLIDGFVNAFKEGGWLPKWASPGYRGTMIGTYGDVVLADAIVNDIKGFDVQTAYKAIRKDAFTLGVDKDPVQRGRNGLQEYLQYGYVPAGGPGWSCDCCCNNVPRTNDYAYADFAIGMAAEKLGFHNDSVTLKKRGMNYKNLFHNNFMVGRNKDGTFISGFNPFDWSINYVEGGPYQYRFPAVYDVEGLAELYGGSEKLCAAIQETITTPPRYAASMGVVHEMREMALLEWGQYAHNNQPVHHILHLAAMTGCPNITQKYSRKVLETMYFPDHFSGDEDNGEMGAWYALTSLGIYPIAPATGMWSIGSPLYRDVEINVPGQPSIRFYAPKNDVSKYLVDSLQWKGANLGKTQITYKDLVSGGTLQFNMK